MRDPRVGRLEENESRYTTGRWWRSGNVFRKEGGPFGRRGETEHLRSRKSQVEFTRKETLQTGLKMEVERDDLIRFRD